MATTTTTRFLSLSLSRTFFLPKPHLTSLLHRPFSTTTIPTRFSLLRLRPLTAIAATAATTPLIGSFRTFSTRRTQSSLNDSNPNWTNRPPKETILLDGCDFEHWLVVMDKPEENMTRDEICDWYVNTLAKVVGSEEEARRKIYSVSTRCYFAFGALVSEELSYKLKDLEGVRWVLPDSYLDVRNKDYGGEPFIDGRPVPYDPKYHEEWERNNARAMERNRRNDRPRNSDRSRNFERRRQNMQNQDYQRGPSPYQSVQQNPAPNTGGPATTNGPPAYSTVNTTNTGVPQNLNSAPNWAGPAPNNMGGIPQNNMGNVTNMEGPPPSHIRGVPPNAGATSNWVPPPNMGPGPNAGWQGNMPNANVNSAPNFQSNGGMQYQNAQPAPAQAPNYQNNCAPNYQNNYAPNDMRGPPVGNTYNTRDMPPSPTHNSSQ